MKLQMSEKKKYILISHVSSIPTTFDHPYRVVTQSYSCTLFYPFLSINIEFTVIHYFLVFEICFEKEKTYQCSIFAGILFTI